jgi:RNA polymerase sigma-70 factor (ECF subfamily)
MIPSETFSERVRIFALRIAESGPEALSGLFDLTAQRLVRYAVTITRNQHDAEDVVQAVLVQVAGQPKLLAKSDQPWHYLLRMVRNRALLIIRERKRTSLVASLCDLLTRRCVDEVEQEETHREVWSALRKLPADQSEVVVLKIWEELTFAQIASVLDVSPSTAASRYRYAMEKLSRYFEPQSREVHYE